MRSVISLALLVQVIMFPLYGRAEERLHRFGGYFESSGKKYAVCISLLENFWFSRGVRAFSGTMTYAVSYFGDIPMSPPGFAVAGNEVRDMGTNKGIILTAFDQNNPSQSNPDLFLKPTEMLLKGNDLTDLKLIQNGQEYDLHLRVLKSEEICSLARPQ